MACCCMKPPTMRLTGLANRTLFGEQVESTLASGVPVALLCLDLDDFKMVNDSLGHPAGDVVLQVVGERLLSLLRPGDAVARLGGDEFVMLVSDLDASTGWTIAQRALAAIRQPIGLAGGRTVHSTASIGIAHGGEGSSIESLLRDADVAMYLAKQSGKAHYEVFQPGMRQDVIDRLEMRAELAEALARNEFVLHYQPIIEVTTGRPVGVEALLRWEHPRRGRVEPMQFIPMAEETELIIPIGRWVLMEACRRAVELDPRPDGLEMAVNVSAVQLRQPGLVDDVIRALNSAGLAPSRLILELTESAVINDIDAAAITLCELRTHGVRIALDDFGAGYASIRHLRAFPVDIVKLDRSFVVSSLENDSTLLSGLIEMASNLGMETVGEGIEEPGQLAMLRSLHCRYAQGYLIARPMPSERLDDVYAIGDTNAKTLEMPVIPATPVTPAIPGVPGIPVEERTSVRYSSRVSSRTERFPALTAVAASERTLPVHESLVELLPCLQRGSTVACNGRAGVSLAMALAAAPSGQGAWVGVAGLPRVRPSCRRRHGNRPAAVGDGRRRPAVGRRAGGDDRWVRCHPDRSACRSPRGRCGPPAAGQGAVARCGAAHRGCPGVWCRPATDCRRRSLGRARPRLRGGNGAVCVARAGRQAHATPATSVDVVARCAGARCPGSRPLNTGSNGTSTSGARRR